MARIKAVFDADILIHLVQTRAIDFAFMTLGSIYVSDYVYQQEIKKDTHEGKQIEKLKNSGNILILEYEKLTEVQKRIYKETYRLLKKEEISADPAVNPINEGERVTASFAKACNIYYYMSDDNRASSHIKSLASVDIVNFCDILFLYLFIFGKDKIIELRDSYKSFLGLYDLDKIPRILKDKGTIRSFEDIMGVSHVKFHQNTNLKRLLENAKINAQNALSVAADEVETNSLQ